MPDVAVVKPFRGGRVRRRRGADVPSRARARYLDVGSGKYFPVRHTTAKSGLT